MRRTLLFLLLTALLSAQAAPEVEITAEPLHRLIFTNDQVRVFDVNIPPNSQTLMHWHRHDYIYVTIGDATVITTVKDKAPVTLNVRDGDTLFVPDNFEHITREGGAKPFRNITIEILQDEKLRHSSVQWDEERALKILDGGTQEILWVKDGIRVSEFQLQPNAAVPSRDHSRPVLLVAVSDLDVFTTDPRTHGGHELMPTPSHFSSGNVTWLPHGFGRPMVNAGTHNAKFVTLEFP